MEGMGRFRWAVIAPIALLVAAVAAIAWLDVTQGGDAEPSAFLGEVGTPVRGTYIPQPATPAGTATPRPRPTLTGNLEGTAEERDARRRNDLLLLLGAANQLKERDGAYPETSNNVQTVCAFQNLDQGCKFGEFLDDDVPSDPTGDPVKNGYWYSSDGQSLKFYAALEVDVPEAAKCATEDAELKKKFNLICVTAP
jgi:hypothetical protein